MSYWAAVVARNAAKQLGYTLDSIFQQTLQPEHVVVVDDGSTDGTEERLSDYAHQYPQLLSVLTLPDRGYDIRRVPRNINLAWRSAEASLKTDFFMISGDDCLYPDHYAISLVQRMLVEPKLVVSSGSLSQAGSVSHEHSPAGSGRMIRCSFWSEIGASYPLKAGWETWLLYKALRKGFRVQLFDDLIFKHVRPRGARHQFEYWGAAMHTLGYNPAYALGRMAKNTFVRSISITGTLSMFRGYLQATLGSADPFIEIFEPSLRKFIYAEQTDRIRRLLKSIL